VEFIKEMPIFKNIHTDVLQESMAENLMYIKDYTKGVTVYNHKDSCNTLDIVLKGSLVAYSLSENGSATVMFEFHKNSILGANLLFGQNNEYPLNIYCLADCKLLHIKKTAVERFLRDYNFVMEYIKSLSQNAQGMNRRIAMFTQKTLRENILDYLRHQSVVQKSSSIVLPISKKQLADYLGVQRQSLFRELKKMKDEKIIDVKNRNIKICQ